MTPSFLIRAAVLATTIFAAPHCLAGVELFPADGVKAWVDVRMVSSDGERGWLDGGLGKTRFGGDDDGVHLAQAALLWQPRLADTVTAYALLQYTEDAPEALSVSEAYVKWKPVPTSSTRYALRLGQMFPPVSMEHDGPGWTTTRTVTPSAINAWIGEEVLVTGAEATVQKTIGDLSAEHVVSAAFGLFTGNDTSGTVLTWRGWALHDLASGHNSYLRLPNGGQGSYTTIFKKQSQLSHVVVDVDGRTGQYVRLGWRPPAPVAFNLTLYNNPGNPTVLRDGQYGWTTRFVNVSVQGQSDESTDILVQYMSGETAMGPVIDRGRRAADIAFDAAYVALTQRLNNGDRLTGRLDYFAVKDRSWQVQDNNTEKGYAATVAWMKPLTDHLDLALELMHVRSFRPSRMTQGQEARQAQTQAQMALRLHL